MADGRIDVQGEVTALCASGALEDIAQGEAHAALEDAHDVAEKTPLNSEESVETAQKGKKPRKLVEEEHRAAGRVKWPIYKIYLTASWVPRPDMTSLLADICIARTGRGPFWWFSSSSLKFWL